MSSQDPTVAELGFERRPSGSSLRACHSCFLPRPARNVQFKDSRGNFLEACIHTRARQGMALPWKDSQETDQPHGCFGEGADCSMNPPIQKNTKGFCF